MTRVPDTRPDLEPSWLDVLETEFTKPYMAELKRFLVAEMKRYPVFPKGREIFNAFWLTPFDKVRVVILGQDPYHGPGQAHGLCFSVRKGVRIPPSLQNIYKELHDDLGIPPAPHGELTHWAQQGVLMLNAVLTVRARSPRSHAGKGWEQFTDRAIWELNRQREGLVFLLWGRDAGQKAQRVDTRKHLVLRSSHPSPYSADRGFFGSRPFSRIDDHLRVLGHPPIDWAVPH